MLSVIEAPIALEEYSVFKLGILLWGHWITDPILIEESGSFLWAVLHFIIR